MTKDEVRKAVWDRMERKRLARFPGARGRIPNFVGAAAAADRLAQAEAWQRAHVLKCNPDAPQRPVRLRALKEGKVVFMAVPRLRDVRCFVSLDPARFPKKALYDASSIGGAFRHGQPIHPQDMPHVDLVIAGSVAVNRSGQRIGKGGGYSDLEWALGREFGFLSAKTKVATTVHPVQVLDEALPIRKHDLTVDLIVTPDQTIEVKTEPRKPGGVDARLISEEMLEKIPILRQIHRKAQGKGPK